MIGYVRQVQCAACLLWRAWALAFSKCPRCGMRIGSQDRLALSRGGVFSSRWRVRVPLVGLASVRAAFRSMVRNVHYAVVSEGVRA